MAARPLRPSPVRRRVWKLVMALLNPITGERPRIHIPIYRFVHRLLWPRRRLYRVRVHRDETGAWWVSDREVAWRVPVPERGYRHLRTGLVEFKEQVMRKYFPDGDGDERCRNRIVVDVGAHIGAFTVAALEAGAVRVIAIDPDPAAFECLQANVGSDPRTELHNVLLSDQDGMQDMYLATARGDTSLIPPPRWDKRIAVKASRLENLIGDPLSDGDILKVEAEGAEPEVLRGAERLITQRQLFVTVRASAERQGESTFSDCEEILRRAGYQCRAGDTSDDPKQLLAERA